MNWPVGINTTLILRWLMENLSAVRRFSDEHPLDISPRLLGCAHERLATLEPSDLATLVQIAHNEESHLKDDFGRAFCDRLV
jgi:hypothetical protein